MNSSLPFELVDINNMALYLNFPFCKSCCSYCHYKNNIQFGYSSIPNSYFELILSQLDSVCTYFRGKHFKSIYFGGGTPSLLSNEQLCIIENTIKNALISCDEVSMELHPGNYNFDFQNNLFITRYSIAVQSFDPEILQSYNRKYYSTEDINNITELIRKKNNDCIINIDLIFDESIFQECLMCAKTLLPDSITIYPNTKNRGVNRLVSVLDTLEKCRSCLSDNYVSLAKSRFIFLKKGTKQSEYAKLEYESFGDIIGIGHNSVSAISDKSFLTVYTPANTILVKKRLNKKNRYLHSFLSSLPVGVTMASVKALFPQIVDGNYLFTVSGNRDINEKHTVVSDDELVYMPETEYIRFNNNLLLQLEDEYRTTFLSSIGFGDTNFETIYKVYNKIIRLNESDEKELRHILIDPETVLYKIPPPQITILVEGIDGSGKDSFVIFLTNELKKRFEYSDESGISVMGQPDSTLSYGVESKRFVEDLVYTSEESIVKELSANRIDSEKKISSLSGIKILIRGIVTDKATFNYIFHRDVNLGEGIVLKKWDYYIVINAYTDTADERIAKRNIPRTWRESINHLKYFSDFYLSYNSDMFTVKMVIDNYYDEESLKNEARKLADRIYANAYNKWKQ